MVFLFFVEEMTKAVLEAESERAARQHEMRADEPKAVVTIMRKVEKQDSAGITGRAIAN